MGQASRTTKLLLDLDDRREGGANRAKRAYLEETAKLLDRARAFYVAFFLAHPDKLAERVSYFSERLQEERERLISSNELLTWAESLTVATLAHPHPLPSYNFSEQFPEFPFIYRRSVIKDALGKARSYLSNLANWTASGAKKGNLARLPPGIIPRSMTKHAVWIWMGPTCTKGGTPASPGSRSTREPSGNGTTIPSN